MEEEKGEMEEGEIIKEEEEKQDLEQEVEPEVQQEAKPEFKISPCSRCKSTNFYFKNTTQTFVCRRCGLEEERE